MNRKKVLSVAIVALLGVSRAFAGSNDVGIEYYRAELYDAAKIFFMQQQNQSSAEEAEKFYYLGETYYDLQQTDSAAICYQKAAAVDAEYPFSYIGEGKIALENGDAKEAEALFKKAAGLAKKNPAIQTAIAEVYIDAKQYKEAEAALDKARKINKNFSGIYVAEGNMLVKQHKLGDAVGRYENAILYNPNDKEAYLNVARAYKPTNPTVALDYLNRLLAVDANYIPAYAELGDIYYSTGFYGKAIEAYEKFIAIQGVPLTQQANYAQLLYFTDQYEASLAQIKKVLEKNPSDMVMYRLQAYNNYKLGNHTVGVELMNRFINSAPEDKHIYLDYLTLGRLQLKEKQPEMALASFEKAATMDAGKLPEIYKEIANTYESMGRYPDAVAQYEKFFEVEETPVVFDYFYYGQANYYAAAAALDPETGNVEDLKKFVDKGTAAFNEVISRSPESYLGYLWKARINSFLDVAEQTATGKMSGIAKPFYEELVNLVADKNEGGARNGELIEAYRYLGSYYILLDDKEGAGEYYKKILGVDPENAFAKETLDALKIKY